MWGDIALKFGENGGEFVVTDDGDLLTDDGMETSVGLCLLTDRRADINDKLPADEEDRRGWWGDTLSDKGFEIGSKIWLYMREKQHREVLHKIREAGISALMWMLGDKVAAAVDIRCVNPSIGRWELHTDISEPDTKQVRNFRHALTWDAQARKH